MGTAASDIVAVILAQTRKVDEVITGGTHRTDRIEKDY